MEQKAHLLVLLPCILYWPSILSYFDYFNGLKRKKYFPAPRIERNEMKFGEDKSNKMPAQVIFSLSSVFDTKYRKS